MARDVLFRTMQLGVAAGLVIGVAIYCARHRLPLLFSSDPRVQNIAGGALPLLAAFMVHTSPTPPNPPHRGDPCRHATESDASVSYIALLDSFT